MRFLKLILFLFVYSNLQSQNLIPNPSFEDIRKCPYYANVNLLKHWKNPSKASPDLLTTCTKNNVYRLDLRGFYEQIAKNGTNCTGIIVYSEGYGFFREYIQARIKNPLKPNVSYCLKMNISLGKSNYAIDSIQAYFSEKSKRIRTTQNINVKPQLALYTDPENGIGETKKERNKWIETYSIYKAIGGEKYITIGNFKDDNRTGRSFLNKYRSNDPDINSAYYLIDDVSLVEMSDSTECSCSKINEIPSSYNHDTTATPGFIPNQKYHIKDVLFEKKTSELLNASIIELNELLIFFGRNKYYIEISGHTDIIGREEDNQKLSEARAKAVADYLVSRGIAKERITYKGYGSSKPVSSNDTEEGRQQNRRVEFMLKE